MTQAHPTGVVSAPASRSAHESVEAGNVAPPSELVSEPAEASAAALALADAQHLLAAAEAVLLARPGGDQPEESDDVAASRSSGPSPSTCCCGRMDTKST